MRNKREYIYHIGIRKDYQRPERVIVEARRDVDYLSCELFEYFGRRVTTKKALRAKLPEFLAWINKEYNTSYTRIILD